MGSMPSFLTSRLLSNNVLDFSFFNGWSDRLRCEPNIDDIIVDTQIVHQDDYVESYQRSTSTERGSTKSQSI